MSIFRQLDQIYKLKRPTLKQLPISIYPAIQQLACLFYQHIYETQFKISTSSFNFFATMKPNQSQTNIVQQAYRQIFYLIPNKNSMAMDYIGCIISLLGDLIITKSSRQITNDKNNYDLVKQKLNEFNKKLRNNKMTLKQYLFLEYTKLTVGLQIAVETSQSIMNKFIIHEFNDSNLDFSSQMKFLEEWEKVKANLKSTKFINQNRIYKRNMKNNHSYGSQIKEIFRQNKEQLLRELNTNQLQNDEGLINNRGPRRGSRLMRNSKLMKMYNGFKSQDMNGKSRKNIETNTKSVNYWQGYVQTVKQKVHSSKIIKNTYRYNDIVNKRKDKREPASNKLEKQYQQIKTQRLASQATRTNKPTLKEQLSNNINDAIITHRNAQINRYKIHSELPKITKWDKLAKQRISNNISREPHQLKKELGKFELHMFNLLKENQFTIHDQIR